MAVVVSLSMLVNFAGFQGQYEDMLKDFEEPSKMKENYRDEVRTLSPLANPVKDYYIETFGQEAAEPGT